MRRLSRRQFLALTAAAAAAPATGAPARPPSARTLTGDWTRSCAYSLAVRTDSAVSASVADAWQAPPRRNPRPPVDWAAAGRMLRQRHPDLARHFIFEYYPWYSTDPWRHWNQWDRQPPGDIAASSLPALGPYDSRDPGVLEQHARWIAESGVGAINLSWWGPGSFEDRAVPLVMDVMRDYGIKVTFHLEPYRNDRSETYASDILYLLREYGEKRRWDAFLLLEDASGRQGPVFKSFATILPFEVTDCKGRVSRVPLWAPESTWRRQTDTVRDTLRRDFDHIHLLADSSALDRTVACGFDGIAIYDNYVRPHQWQPLAERCARADLLFSFNINAGFDGIEPRAIDPDGCHTPLAFEPPAEVNWRTREGRRRAESVGRLRIGDSAATTLALQTDPALSNMRRGFFAVYINSFNEWHEGTMFEPMRPFDTLTPAQQTLYHNAVNGRYRLEMLARLLEPVLEEVDEESRGISDRPRHP